MLGFFPQLGAAGAVALCVVLGGVSLGHRQLLRVPLVAVFVVLLALDLAIYTCTRSLISLCELFLTARLHKRKGLQRKMRLAGGYKEWATHASQLDEHEGRRKWKHDSADKDYHPHVVAAALKKLRSARAHGSADVLVQVLRPCLVKNFGGVMNYEMYCKCHCGTKQLVEEYFAEVRLCVRHLAALAREDHRAREVVRGFLPAALQSYGKTSLLLSGGAYLGFYHVGILRALLAEDLLPNSLCGTSMGAIILAFLASRTNAEALHELQRVDGMYAHSGVEGGPLQGSKLWKAWQVLRKGHIYEIEECEKHVQWFTQGMTFLEAYTKTGRNVNITCTPYKTRVATGLPPLLLNHVTTPHVTLTSAILASACVPKLMPPVQLMEKCPDGSIRPYPSSAGAEVPPAREESLEMVLMRDGSFESDVPVQAMSAFFNSHFNIVSQVNPHIIPFFFNPDGAIGRPIRWPWTRSRGGFIMSLVVSWVKEDMLKLLRVMRDMDLTFRVFGVDFRYLFLQEEQGDVTIVPNVGVRDYWHLLDNAGSRRELERIIRQSERACWRHFGIIQNRLLVERALEGLEQELGRG